MGAAAGGMVGWGRGIVDVSIPRREDRVGGGICDGIGGRDDGDDGDKGGQVEAEKRRRQ